MPRRGESWARWATNQALSSQALKAWTQVVSILPDDPEANRALGRVQLDGQWVTEEESYRAQGYIEFEGQWMTPGERQTILADRQDREEADGRANEARIKEIEAEIEEEKQRKEDERREARDRNRVHWGWGYGPTYWPQPTQPWEEDGRRR